MGARRPRVENGGRTSGLYVVERILPRDVRSVANVTVNVHRLKIFLARYTYRV